MSTWVKRATPQVTYNKQELVRLGYFDTSRFDIACFDTGWSRKDKLSSSSWINTSSLDMEWTKKDKLLLSSWRKLPKEPLDNE